MAAYRLFSVKNVQATTPILTSTYSNKNYDISFNILL